MTTWTDYDLYHLEKLADELNADAMDIEGVMDLKGLADAHRVRGAAVDLREWTARNFYTPYERNAMTTWTACELDLLERLADVLENDAMDARDVAEAKRVRRAAADLREWKERNLADTTLSVLP